MVLEIEESVREKMKIETVTNCPACKSILERVKDQLFCKNTRCEATSSKRVLHFVKTLKILGLGEKTLERLGVDSVPYVYQMSKQYMTDVLGETTGEKLYDRIQASKQVPLSRFITALAIPLVGKSVGEKIEESISEGFWELTEEICKKAGVGAKASLNLCYWIKENKLYKDLPVDLTYGDNK
jgi:NAD-dependent DNA ligase